VAFFNTSEAALLQRDSGALPSAAKTAISYEFKVDAHSLSSISIDVHFKGGPEGFTVLGLCLHRGLADEKCDSMIEDLRVRDKSTGKVLPLEHPEPKVWVFDNSPNAEVTVSYKLASVNPAEVRSGYESIRTEDLATFFGNVSLVVPEHILNKPGTTINYRWVGDYPSIWKPVSSFGLGDWSQELHLPLTSFVNSFFAIGRYLYTDTVDPDRQALRAVWFLSRPSTETQEAIQNLLTSVRRSIPRTMQIDDHPTWFFLPTHPKEMSAVSLTSGIVIFRPAEVSSATASSRSEWLALQLSVAHELTHKTRLGRLSISESPGDPLLFSEGSAEFLPRHFLFQAGLISPADWMALVSEKLARYDLLYGTPNSPSAALNVADDRNYILGDILKIWIDSVIRQRSSNKQNVVDFLTALTLKGKDLGEVVAVPWPTFLSTLSEFTSAEFVKNLTAFATAKQHFELPGSLFAGCADIKSGSGWSFDPGLDVQASIAAEQIKGVRAESEAWKAGLRDGQPMTWWDIKNGRADLPVEVIVQIEDYQRHITYFPRGSLLPYPVHTVSLAQQGSQCRSSL